jgi:hypothetical protein
VPDPQLRPWERLRKESAQAFEGFVIYRDMGADRSLAKVAERLGKSTTLVERWSARDAWVTRVEAWETEQDREWIRQQQVHRRETGKRQLRLANAMQSALVGALANVDPKKLSPRDLATWLDVTAKVQRQALGLGDRIEVTGADGGPVELAQLSPDQVQARMAKVGAEIQRRLQANPDRPPLGVAS